MVSLTKIGDKIINSHRNLEISIGIYRNPIGIYKDHVQIDGELEKDRRKINKIP